MLSNPLSYFLSSLSVCQLCSDLIEDWVKRNPKASICSVEGVSEFKDIALYQDYHGLPAFRNVWKLIHLPLFFILLMSLLVLSPVWQLSLVKQIGDQEMRM